MSCLRARIWLGLVSGAGLCGAAYADRPTFNAIANVEQLSEAYFSGSGDDVTYMEASLGLAGQISNRRIVASGTYRASVRLPESGKLDKTFTQNGVMRLQAQVIDEWLTVDTGVLVTRSRVDPSGAAPLSNSAGARNLTQTYSTFFQPSIAHYIGDLRFSANYSYAYTKNQGSQQAFAVGIPVNRFDSSKSQQAQLAFGMENSFLPFDWTVSSRYSRENTTSLAQHIRSASVIGDIKMPIAERIAFVASGGYEKSRNSQRSALIDPLTGLPISDPDGRFVVDPASPRVLTYDVAGLIGDAGIIWRPSQRTRLEARAGYRYGGLTYTGLLEMRPDRRSGLTFVVSDSIQSFGQEVSGGLAGAPPSLDLGQSADPNSSYQDCLFGKSAGTGRCIGGALGQASANSYRERSASMIYTHQLRRWQVGITMSYSRRTYIDDPNSPVTLAGVVDQSFLGDVNLSGKLTRTSGVSFSFSGNLFKNGQTGAADVKSGSVRGGYYRTFGRGIRAQASLSVEASKQDGVTADVSGRAQLGVQYEF